jgi:U3 small nucleolar RNA-associated protein 13
VQLEDYRSAIVLALGLDQPRRLLGLFTQVAAKRDPAIRSITGSPEVDDVLAKLPLSDTLRLLQHVRAWNTSVRSSDVAQAVLHAVLRSRSAEDILALGNTDEEAPDFGSQLHEGGVKQTKQSRGVVSELLEALVPYTERHFSRADKMLSQESFLIDYTLSQMLDGFEEDGDVEMEEGQTRKEATDGVASSEENEREEDDQGKGGKRRKKSRSQLNLQVGR